MRVLLSTIGTRGEVQPMVALATALRALGAEARLCVPPDFRKWVEGLGFPVVPIGPALRGTASGSGFRPTPEQLRALAEGTVVTQFATLPEAAEGCDAIVAGGGLQIAARSVAEAAGLRYVHASYCPVALPSAHHAPPPLALQGRPLAPDDADHRALWAEDAAHVNATFRDALNARRKQTGLPPVDDVRGHMLGATPWLAADPVLGPWPGTGNELWPGAEDEPCPGTDDEPWQPGAWLLPDDSPLSPTLEDFLAAGEPPVYFGFGSIRATPGLAEAMTAAARAAGRRALISRGWAGLALVDDAPDCLSVGDVNQRALFPRVAAVVHHGGAGTTTAAALAGAPQVIAPQMYDQHYWARRVRELGTGAAHPPAPPTADSLTAALRQALHPDTAARARALGARVRTDGARRAAERLLTGGAPAAPGPVPLPPEESGT
ncbi:glycosyltransferase [Streptomyces huiliensis]|uniref:glycosyltransferase n=1 Tax=Streptomyces huiliensis TaxID=2876027 RepID=UPI001CC031A6|nr:glycosyltransferase [Streptomyces huiliensis]MBZ4321521.1 glycosyltransferase [Streptomyces huiliensis]